MPSEETVAVEYRVHCSNMNPDPQKFYIQDFFYVAQAPASICETHSSYEDGPDPDATGLFITSLIDRHHAEILNSRVWHCITCGNRATELLHSAVPLLSAGEGAAPDFQPTVLDNAVPICRSGGQCDREAEKVVQAFEREMLTVSPLHTVVHTKTCDRCGKKTGVKVCGGCKLIAYVDPDLDARYCNLENVY